MEQITESIRNFIAEEYDVDVDMVTELNISFKIEKGYQFGEVPPVSVRGDKGQKPETKKKKGRGRKKGSKNKPKDDVIAGAGAD